MLCQTTKYNFKPKKLLCASKGYNFKQKNIPTMHSQTRLVKLGIIGRLGKAKFFLFLW